MDVVTLCSTGGGALASSCSTTTLGPNRTTGQVPVTSARCATCPIGPRGSATPKADGGSRAGQPVASTTPASTAIAPVPVGVTTATRVRGASLVAGRCPAHGAGATRRPLGRTARSSGPTASPAPPIGPRPRRHGLRTTARRKGATARSGTAARGQGIAWSISPSEEASEDGAGPSLAPAI